MTARDHLVSTQVRAARPEAFDVAAGSPRDAAELADLASRTFRDTYASVHDPRAVAIYIAGAFTQEQIETEIREPGTAFFLARIPGGAVIGYAKVRSDRGGEVSDSASAELQRLYVDLPWQGEGVGAALMRAALQWAASSGYTRLWCGVEASNDRALRFYERSGFRRDGTNLFRLGPETHVDVALSRRIDAAAGRPD